MMFPNFRQPMLADDLDMTRTDIDGWVSRKIDGFRLALVNGKACTRSMKEPANKYVADVLRNPKLQGLDGEVVVGPPNATNTLSVTQSAMKRIKGEPDFTFHVFDWVDLNLPFPERHRLYDDRVRQLRQDFPFLRLVNQYGVENLKELEGYEQQFLEEGYEGLMYRKREGMYVCSRASNSAKSSHLLKLKRFTTGECRIVGTYEQEQNNNEAFLDERGFTKRATLQENKVGKGTLGGFHCVTIPDANLPYAVPFNLGIGKDGSLDDAARDHFWSIRDTLDGEIATFQFFKYGMVNGTPRFPKFISLRAAEDMGSK